VHGWIQKNCPELKTRIILISGDTAKQRYAGIPGAKANTVHREAFSSAAIDINGGEDIRETMSDEMKHGYWWWMTNRASAACA